jgi:hypothetical protein
MSRTGAIPDRDASTKIAACALHVSHGESDFTGLKYEVNASRCIRVDIGDHRSTPN